MANKNAFDFQSTDKNKTDMTKYCCCEEGLCKTKCSCKNDLCKPDCSK